MSNNIVLIGDLHAAVDDAPPPPAPQPEPGDAPAREPRAVVIVVDLRDTASKGDAKAALRRAAEVAVDAARGYAKVRHEWALICTVHNLAKLLAARAA